MFNTELTKPSSTGCSTADILPDITALQWSRTEPPQVLLELMKDPDHQPMVVFPTLYAGEEREAVLTPPADRPPLSVMLGGIQPEVREMLRKSPYLDNLPVISVDLSCLSAYRLRGVHTEG